MTIVEVSTPFRDIKLWIVTYDLPSKSTVQRMRRRFYRHLRKWLQDHKDSQTVWMTMSTVITQSRDFADFVMKEIDDLNLIGARASMYEASMLKIIGRPQQFTQPTSEQISWMFSS